MAGLESHIRRMYADIASYSGGFGDGVESGPYDPFEAVAGRGLTPFERAGVSVAAYPVSTRVNDVRNDDPGCIAPLNDS